VGATTTTTLLTFEEFEHLPDAPGKHELLDGELIELPPPKRRHTLIQHRIAEALRRYAVERDLLVFVEAGFRLGARRSEWLQPDVSVVSSEQEERAAIDPDGYYQGSPLIAVEALVQLRDVLDALQVPSGCDKASLEPFPKGGSK